MNGVKIQFDANQNYQLKAVDAVVNLFKGLSPEELGNNQGEFSLSQNDKETDCTANVDDLFEFDESELLDSFNEVRKDNNLQPKPYWGSTDFNDGDTSGGWKESRPHVYTCFFTDWSSPSMKKGG